jgi:hypothetical protein
VDRALSGPVDRRPHPDPTPTEEDAMSATTTRRAARLLLLTAVAPAAVALSVFPASASPWPGDPVPPTADAVVWGWPGGADGPAYVGQRFGANLPPQLRGHVLELLDR